MDRYLAKLKVFSKSSDLLVAVSLLAILVIMFVPISPFFLDLAIATSLSLAMVVLLISVYTKKPLDFSTFPAVLLILTLYRLSLNVASTRNILLRGSDEGSDAAGTIISSFGEFVVGGNFVVGLIIFIILVIINFLVVTKGAGRVAEVGARFTLDAMPGKQMAIDADLNAGLINENEARDRRKNVAEEADFYGAMDGASKFVRGDAIAGILITIINIIGGIIIGVAQNGLSFTEALSVFSILTVGDGLVSQIPALIISTAAGIIITRNTNEDSLGEQVSKQFKIYPKAIYISGFVLFIFASIPGLPKFPFFVMSFSLFYIARKIEKNKSDELKLKMTTDQDKETTKEETLDDLLNLELLELNIGYGLVNIVDTEQDGDLLERINQLRKQFATDWGVILPFVKIKDDLELAPGGYSIKVKGIEVGGGELRADHFMAMDPGTVIEEIDGIETTEPVFGLPAFWIRESQKDDAQYNGYTVVDTSTIVATHLTEILKANLHELVGRQEALELVDKLKEKNPKIVSDLIPDILSLGVVLKVLQNLLREGISIRDLRTILETLAEYGPVVKDPDLLTENVRQSLFRTITEKIKGEEGEISLFTLDRTVEETIVNNIVQAEHTNHVNLDPQMIQNLLSSINEKIEEATKIGEKMVVLCSPMVRNHFKRITEKYIPNLIVVSHNELAPDASIRSLGTVRL
jgi:flagellar biosynthesis protein FlhA